VAQIILYLFFIVDLIMLKMKIEYYIDSKNKSPVLEYIKNLPVRDVAFIQAKIAWAGNNNQFTRDFFTKFKGMNLDLGEFRTGSYRIIVLRTSTDSFLMLHAFRKTTNETPEREIKIAYNRAIDYLRRNPFQ